MTRSKGTAAIVSGVYAAIVLCLLTLAMVTTDEFGFRFLPAFYLTYPWSWLIDATIPFVPLLLPVILGGAINTLILYFAISIGLALFRKPSGTK
jgi:hypothetical protein